MKVVIIGAGLGGLTTGALLSNNGYDVTILEQHNIVGGCASFFKRKDFTCEVGLHEMNGVFDNPIINETFKELEVYKNIDFIKIDEFYKLYSKNNEFEMPHGLNRVIKLLKDKFPEEIKNIDKYFKALDDVSNSYAKLASAKWYELILFPFFFSTIIKYKSKSVKEVLDSIIDNEELKLVLNANVQYYNESASTLCFLLHALAQYSYLQEGGYFIKGGSYKLSDYLASIITKNGGKVITKANAIKATKEFVKYAKKGEVLIEKADIIVSNISPYDTYKIFDIKFEEKKQISQSLISIYLGFSKNLKDVYGKKAYSNFIFDDISNLNEFDYMLKKDICNRGFIFVDYSQIDSGLVEKNKSFGVISLMDDIKNWNNLEKKEYENKKEKILTSFLEKLEKYYPNIKNLVEYSELATPKTIKRYIKTPEGTAYGYKPNPVQFFRIPKLKSEKVDNLYFTGQFTISGGFSATIMSGKMCYKKIIKNF